MVDYALPPSDRADEMTPEEQAEANAAAARLAVEPVEEFKPPPVNGSACVTLSRVQWEWLIRSLHSPPPLVNRAVGAIRKTLDQQAGERVTVSGSVAGWCELLNYCLRKGIACNIAALISAQVSKGN